jgi:hypothetical protein
LDSDRTLKFRRYRTFTISIEIATLAVAARGRLEVISSARKRSRRLRVPFRVPEGKRNYWWLLSESNEMIGIFDVSCQRDRR